MRISRQCPLLLRRPCISGEKHTLTRSESTVFLHQISIQLGNLLAAAGVAELVLCNAAQGR
jgi:hypothetical protein